MVYAPIIMPLCGPSCKLRFARISAKLRFQDGPSVAICEALGINDVNLQVVKKQDIIRAVKGHDGREMVEQMEKYQKLDKLKEDNPTQAKNYLETKSISDCRVTFRIRTEMMDLKDNMRRRYKGSSTNCEACDEEGLGVFLQRCNALKAEEAAENLITL